MLPIMFNRISLIESQIRVFGQWMEKRRSINCNLEYLEDIEKVCHVNDILDLTDKHVVDFLAQLEYKVHTKHAILAAEHSINAIRRFYMARGKNAKMPVGRPPHVERIEQVKKLKEMGLSYRQIARATQVDVAQAFRMVNFSLEKLNPFKKA